MESLRVPLAGDSETPPRGNASQEFLRSLNKHNKRETDTQPTNQLRTDHTLKSMSDMTCNSSFFHDMKYYLSINKIDN